MAHQRLQSEQNGDASSRLQGPVTASTVLNGAPGRGAEAVTPAHIANTAAASNSAVDALAAAEEEKKRREFETEKALVVADPVIATQKSLFESIFVLRESCSAAEYISPGMMLQFCELRSNLLTFTSALRNEVNYLTREKFRHIAGLESLVVKAEKEEVKAAGKRRLSVFGGGKKPVSEPSGASTAVAKTKQLQLLAIQESGSDDDSDPITKQKSIKLVPRGRGSMNAGPTPAATSNSNGSEKQGGENCSAIVSSGATVAVSRPGRGSMNAGGLHSPLRGAEATPPAPQGTNSPVFARGRNSRVAPDSSGGGLTGMKGTMLVMIGGPSDSGSGNNTPNGSVKEDGSPTVRNSMTARQTMFRISLNQVATRHSMLNRLRKLVGSQAIEELRARAGSADFDLHVKKLTQDPTSWKNRIWILLELPHSSKEAKTLQIVLIFLIMFSIFILYTQTSINLSLYGESTEMCGKVLQLYCQDKFDNTADTGCFAHFPNGTVSSAPLAFDCQEDYCYKMGANFGAANSSVTCANTAQPPFQNAASLDYRYGRPYLFTSRLKMHHINPICTRIECQDNSSQYTDVRFVWVVVEFLLNVVFTVEMTLRLLVCESVVKFMSAYLNVFDILSLVPFYLVLVNTLLFTSFKSLNFAILASSPDPIFLVTMRALKVSHEAAACVVARCG
jgi:hypothetical protein